MILTFVFSMNRKKIDSTVIDSFSIKESFDKYKYTSISRWWLSDSIIQTQILALKKEVYTVYII